MYLNKKKKNNKLIYIMNNNILPLNSRIIVIGDLHADFNKTKEIFFKLKLINDNNKWIAHPKNTIIVQLGDQVDGGGRGQYSINGEMEVIDFLDNIHEQAKIYGGGVYSLIGNHELMNFLGDYSYTSKDDMQNKSTNFLLGSDFAKKLADNRRVILKIGPYLFVHAGIVSSHLESNNRIDSVDGVDSDLFINKVNDLMKKLLYNEISKNDSEINKFFNSNDSLLWTRKLGGNKVNCDDFEKVSQHLNVGHIFVGHTIQNQINSKCSDKVWRLDVGISDAFGKGGKMQVLEIDSSDRASPKFNVIKL